MTKFHYASTKDRDLLYLLQYRITDPFFYLEHDGKQFVYLSSTDIEAYRENTTSNVEAVSIDPFLKKVQPADIREIALTFSILEANGISSIAVPTSFPLHIADALRAAHIELTVIKDWCPDRQVKTREEIGHIERNMQKTQKAFLWFEDVLTEAEIVDDTIVYKGTALTSEYVKTEIETLLLREGMDNPEGLIVSCGRHAAMPHHEGGGLLRPHETIIVDIFPQSRNNHYFADMTRTYVKGEPSEKVARMYEAVLASQLASLDAIRPRMLASELHETSRKVILEHGFDVGDVGYVHSLGHGLGVDVHEAPSLGPNAAHELQPGYVVTIEPGLYYEDHGGVRIEDTVVVTEDGYRNLTDHPKDKWIF